MAHYHRRFTFVALSVIVTLVVLIGSSRTVHGQGSTVGGFTDSATSVGLRPRFSAAQIQGWLPERGGFNFPAPYSTQGIRITNASDCGGARTASLPVGYSYWSNINNHASSDTMLIVLGLDRRRGGGGPDAIQLQQAHRRDSQRWGRSFPPDSPYSWSTGEGWYFSATQADGPLHERRRAHAAL